MGATFLIKRHVKNPYFGDNEHECGCVAHLRTFSPGTKISIEKKMVRKHNVSPMHPDDIGYEVHIEVVDYHFHICLNQYESPEGRYIVGDMHPVAASLATDLLHAIANSHPNLRAV